MIIYRFERNGLGPYTSSSGINLFSQPKTRTSRKYLRLRNKFYDKLDPIERQKNWGKSHGNKEYLFGCSSKDQLRAYFGGNFKDLFKQGFRIKRYRVPDDEVLKMGLEVAFPVKYHKLQKVRKIQELRA